MNFLALPMVLIINAFLTGVFTKLGDIANDDGFKISYGLNILLGILWGIFGSLVVLGNSDVAAFYFGILLSWIFRYKLDNYCHGIGGTIILVALFYVHPISTLQIIMSSVTFILFTLFGLLSRNHIVGKNFFVDYNVYSFIFLVILTLANPSVWIVIVASLANILGYHGVKIWWNRNRRIERV